MSDSPFQDSLDSSPGSSPPGDSGHGNPLAIPAVFLLILSSLFLLLLLLSLPMQLIRMMQIDITTARGAGQFTGSICMLPGWTVYTLAIAAGSIGMLRLKGLSIARWAAGLAVVPFCSPFFVLGIPFGIWALVLLRKPEVKDRFA